MSKSVKSPESMFIEAKKAFMVKILNEICEDEEKATKYRTRELNFLFVVSRCFMSGNKLNNNLMWDANNIYEAFQVFATIMFEINGEFEVLPTKELFSQFMGWSTETYQTLLHGDDASTRSVMGVIEDYLIQLLMSSAESGRTKASISKHRTQIAGGHGHGLVTQKDENIENRLQGGTKSKEQLQQDLDKLKIDYNK